MVCVPNMISRVGGYLEVPSDPNSLHVWAYVGDVKPCCAIKEIWWLGLGSQGWGKHLRIRQSLSANANGWIGQGHDCQAHTRQQSNKLKEEIDGAGIYTWRRRSRSRPRLLLEVQPWPLLEGS
jgi:hypothetical protein